jgi:hypothetical protein
MDGVTARIADLMGPASLEILGGSGPRADGDAPSVEADMVRAALSASSTAYAHVLEAFDDELRRFPPAGTRIRDRRRRTMGTRLGDATFVRRTCTDRFGNTVVPVGDAIGLAARARVSPFLESELVLLAAKTSCRMAAEALRVESDGTMVNLQHEGGDGRYEARALVAYAGKAGGTGTGDRKVRRMRPVGFGCAGTASQMRVQGVAAVGSVHDITKVKVVRSGFDGAGWCEGDVGFLGFAETVVGRLDPFHVNRAFARCFDAVHAGERSEALAEAYRGHACACADLLGAFADEGKARPSVVAAVAPYLRGHASCMGVAGPSPGTMEPENQHVYQSGLSSVPCAWTRRGADSVARIRSRQASGREVPHLSRTDRVTPEARARREQRIDGALRARPDAAQVVSCEGKGREYPARASTTGHRAGIQFESGLRADHKLVDPR